MIAVGTPVSRIDGPAKVTGRAKYAADNSFPSMLHAVLVCSTIAAGAVRSIDTTAAMAVQGAVAIFTHQNARIELFGRALPDLNRFSLGGWFPMTGPEIHFAGQVVAIVVATSLLSAREAAAAVAVEYDSVPVSLDLNDGNSAQPSFFFGEEMQVSVGATCDAVKAPHTISANLADYHVPVNLDVPQIDVLFVNEPDLQFNELGARGLGEIGLPGCAAAIANAVYSATGKRFRNLPITPKDLTSI